ncbi:hypothetical protein [Methanobrevibacter sp.]|uniref:hypothetical protein n=1 Tax=Methanobrevibacter sp. TaxID=66852 RepID=UPI00388E8BEC
MNKKIFLFSIAVLIAIAGLSVVAAVGADSQGETVTIEGIDFNIPKGFKENKTFEIVNQSDETAGLSYVMNGKSFEKGADFMSLLVSEYDGLEVTDDIVAATGGDAKNIGGQDGYMANKNPYTTFSYHKNGKLVVLSTDNPDLFEEFIV